MISGRGNTGLNNSETVNDFIGNTKCQKSDIFSFFSIKGPVCKNWQSLMVRLLNAPPHSQPPSTRTKENYCVPPV